MPKRIYGLDCMPREDLRKIGARDRHAAHKIAEIRQRHPNAVIFVLFGESHLAPGHLAARTARADARSKSSHRSAEYRRALLARGRRTREQVEAVRVNDDVVCVFNSHAAGKVRELSPVSRAAGDARRRRSRSRAHDLQPDRQPGALSRNQSLFVAQRHAAEVPGRHAAGSLRRLIRRHLRRLLSRQGMRRRTKPKPCCSHVEERGSAYLPQVNAFLRSRIPDDARRRRCRALSASGLPGLAAASRKASRR